MTTIDPIGSLEARIASQRRTWLVTGCAGFIGSHLLEALLRLDQRVIGLDNFSTGHERNLDDVRRCVAPGQWARFELTRADIRDPLACAAAARDAGIVLHQAALGSVPRSLQDPRTTHDVNVNGFLNMLLAARDAGVSSFVYAASSSAYGDHPDLPKVEERIGNPLSPYALSKRIDEMMADVFGRCYGFDSIGLRYFNVFGKRQDPNGAYAAVIPRWINAMIAGDEVVIHGDGSNSRDFCYIANVVQANLLAAMAPPASRNQVYNIGVGDNTSLSELYSMLKRIAEDRGLGPVRPPMHGQARPGDVAHSQADIGKARRLLGYQPAWRIGQGLEQALPWYIENHAKPEAGPHAGRNSRTASTAPASSNLEVS